MKNWPFCDVFSMPNILFKSQYKNIPRIVNSMNSLNMFDKGADTMRMFRAKRRTGRILISSDGRQKRTFGQPPISPAVGGIQNSDYRSTKHYRSTKIINNVSILQYGKAHRVTFLSAECSLFPRICTDNHFFTRGSSDGAAEQKPTYNIRSYKIKSVRFYDTTPFK